MTSQKGMKRGTTKLKDQTGIHKAVVEQNGAIMQVYNPYSGAEKRNSKYLTPNMYPMQFKSRSIR